MPHPRPGLLALLGTAALAGACGEPAAPSPTPTAGGSSAPTAATAPPAAAAPTAPSAGARSTREGSTLRITIGGETLRATLADSAAARDLVAQLPVTIDMVEHGGVEKTGRLPEPLSLDGQPAEADPDVGDLGYYAPGQDLVLYHGNQSSYPGIVVLGRLEDDAAARVAGLERAVTATVEVLR